MLSVDDYLKSEGLSLQDFLAWKAKRYGEPKKQSRKEWLDGYSDCGHCLYDGTCGRQNIGYHQPIDVVTEGNNVVAMASGPHYNRRRPQGLQSCCRWHSDTANALHDKADKLVKEGLLL